MGSGTFAGQHSITLPTGPNSEPANAIFTAAQRKIEVDVIQVDNHGLGGQSYVLILIVPSLDGLIKGAGVSAEDLKSGEAPVFTDKAQALAKAEEISLHCIHHTHTHGECHAHQGGHGDSHTDTQSDCYFNPGTLGGAG